MPHSRAPRRAAALAATIGSILLAAAQSSSASASVKAHFDIPPQALGSALRTLAESGDLQLVFPPDVVAGLQTEGLRGEYTALEALNILIQNSGLTYSFDGKDTVVVRRQTQAYADGRIHLAQASAASSDGAEGGIETQIGEVTVTAQKRSESIINVPISMSVVGPDELEARRVVKLDDYILSIPNVTFTNYGSFSPVVSIRGITSGVGGQFDPIGVTVDDISYGTTETDVINSARFFDLERIEVLRGPQGTLTGSNSTGGTLAYVSAQPDPGAPEIKGTLEYGRYDTMSAKGVLNMPLNDRLALRTVLYSERSDGAVKNIGPGGGDSGYRNDGGRVALRWLASDRLTLDLSFATEQQRRGLDSRMYSNIVHGGFSYDVEDGDGNVIETLYGTEAARAQAAAMGVDFDNPALGFIQNRGNNRGYVSFDVPERHDITNTLASAKLSYELDRHTLSLMYGYFHHKHEALRDFDYTEFALERGYFNRYDTSNSVELRMGSKYEGPVNWVAGVVRHDENNPYGEYYWFGDGEVGGEYPELAWKWGNYQRLLTEAVYGNVFWDISDRLHLSVGGRYNRSTSEYGEVEDDDPTHSNVPLPAIETDKGTLKTFSPRVALNYDLRKDATVYLQYATGFRDGYSNGRAAGLHLTDRNDPPVPFEVPENVDVEHVKNYELGFKGLFLDRRLSLATAVFYMDYTDLQVYGGSVIDLPDEPGFNINAGKASVKGFEVEATLYPVAGLELHAGVGYVDSKIKEVRFTDEDVLTDVKMPGVRPWTVNASASYQHPLGINDLRAHYRADYVWQARNYDSLGEADVTDIYPSFDTLNLSLGVGAEKWDVSFFVDNVLDEKYWLASSTDFTAPIHGAYVIFQPRAMGIRMNVRFKGN